MLLNPKIKEMVENRYYEMKSKNLTELFFDKPIFGNIRMFINKKPTYSLASFEIEDGSQKVSVFLGSDII